MPAETTLEIEHCVVCGLQKASKDLGEYMWEEFYSLYVQVEPLLHPIRGKKFTAHDMGGSRSFETPNHLRQWVPAIQATNKVAQLPYVCTYYLINNYRPIIAHVTSYRYG